MIEDHEKAVEDFDLLIKKSPKNAHAYFRRAFSQKALKNYSEAAEDFEKAKELDPLNPKMVVNYKKLKGEKYSISDFHEKLLKIGNMPPSIMREALFN